MGSSITLHQWERAGGIPIETRAHDAMEVDMNMNFVICVPSLRMRVTQWHFIP